MSKAVVTIAIKLK